MLGLSIVIVTIILIILSILFFPTVEVLGKKLSTYWMIAIIGAFTLVMTYSVDLKNVAEAFSFSSSEMNPIKILILFISMTILSIFLDEIGMFRYIAIVAVKKFKNNQFKLFFGLYFLISFLTIFTSNDIIILTFTPFVCYYAKHAKINPIPYLISEFVAANTWSMLLIIGNPTNIYLATAFNIDFVSYLLKMIVPTILASVISLSILTLVFYKNLKEEMTKEEEECPKINKFLLIIGLIHLISCTILVAISSYIDLDMWLITLCFALSLLIITSIYNIASKKYEYHTINTIKRAPWSLIPFVISMFIIVEALKECGVISTLTNNLPNNAFAYGYSSMIAANLINNIPMSVLFSNIIPSSYTNMIYATIISSNISAFITPIGALAGIMWMNLLKTYNVKFTFAKFMGYGSIIGIPTITIALSALLI